VSGYHFSWSDPLPWNTISGRPAEKILTEKEKYTGQPDFKNTEDGEYSALFIILQLPNNELKNLLVKRFSPSQLILTLLYSVNNDI